MKKVLIIDDESINIDVLCGILDNKYEILVALDGKSAIDILNHEKVDLILLDIMMPNMDGFETCEKIKENENLKNIPIIFSTAKTDEDSIENAYKVGAVDYIVKPLKAKEVIARVKNHIFINSKKQELEEKVQKEVEKNIAKEKILVQKSKIASIGEMMDAVAHQWKQPIGIINMIVAQIVLKDKMKKDITSQDIQGLEVKVREQTTHMNDTLNSFRKFFSEKQNKVYINLKKEINSILDLVRDDIIKHKLKVSVSGDDSIDYELIESDFKHVIINFISNSKDAFNENKIENRIIDIKFFKHENSLKLIYCDNAGGIDKENIEDIFKIYITTKEENEGSGIGLYLCKQIMEKIDATIDVENIKSNDTNIGAKFTLTFPLF
jgi:CheY-like chemotaxis protein/anti-sigma regulatory factor (Ser/Thr protein kinase)